MCGFDSAGGVFHSHLGVDAIELVYAVNAREGELEVFLGLLDLCDGALRFATMRA